MKKLLEKFHFELLHAFNFSRTWKKGAKSWWQNFVTIAYMVNSFVFSLDIPVMIDILYEMIKTLHEERLNAICFC